MKNYNLSKDCQFSMDTIPESWTKVYLYGEVIKGVRRI